VYREASEHRSDRELPEPEIVMKSIGDGTKTNLENWLTCIRTRQTPNANVRAGVEAARTSHLANQAMRQAKVLLNPIA
jgi:hypothetical protein